MVHHTGLHCLILPSQPCVPRCGCVECVALAQSWVALICLECPGCQCRLVSRAGCGVKGDKLRQFCCINGRPVELPRAIKILNDTYK
jgi:hypothetical protein